MAALKEEDDWENATIKEFKKIDIKAGDASEKVMAPFPLADARTGKAVPEVDPAIIEALNNPQERKAIADLEEMTIKFIRDTSRDILEFPAQLGSYQKMLAHRVSQAYGLQTSKVDYEDGPGRVIANRTKETVIRKVKLVNMDLSAIAAAGDGMDSHAIVADRTNGATPKLLKRPTGPDQGHANDTLKTSNSAQSMKEREDDYNRARERIIGAAEPAGHAGGGRGSSTGAAPGRGGVPGRGGRAGFGGRDSLAGRGRGRKAVFRDRDREMQDPDYVRGGGRDAPSQPYDQQGYGNDGYHDPYASQGQWGGAPGYRPPPPPPRPHSSSGFQGGQHGSKQGPAAAASIPQAPGMGGMYPAAGPGMAGGGQAQMPRGGYPAGVPMAPYPMAGYPAQMAGYPGMVGQQAMYAPGYGYMASPPASYGYMAGPDGMQGAYPMYTAGYAMYPQPMTAMQMPQQGAGGGMRGMPGQGMEAVYYAPAPYAYAVPVPKPGPQPGTDGKPAGSRVQAPSCSITQLPDQGGAPHDASAAQGAKPSK